MTRIDTTVTIVTTSPTGVHGAVRVVVDGFGDEFLQLHLAAGRTFPKRFAQLQHRFHLFITFCADKFIKRDRSILQYGTKLFGDEFCKPSQELQGNLVPPRTIVEYPIELPKPVFLLIYTWGF